MKYIIVGFGNIGHKRQKVLGNKCLATVDIDPSKKPDFLDSSLVSENIIKKIQSIIIATSQEPKLELVKYWLSKGKNVLIEKPFIITPKDSKELSHLAKENQVIWYTSYNHRFEPNIIKLKKIIDTGKLGPLYYGRLIYNFGNIKERLGTWRETEYSVLEEIAPHLIDFANFFFNYSGKDFQLLQARKVESSIFDHWLFTTTDQKLTLEVSAVTWKNIFSIDLYFEQGSIHLNSLRKWGGGELILRKRIFPAGIPLEKKSFDSGSDLTWQKDLQYFEKLVKSKKLDVTEDLNVSLALAKLSLAATPAKKNSQQIVYQEIINA